LTTKKRPGPALRPALRREDPLRTSRTSSVNPNGTEELILTAGEPGTPRAEHFEEDRAPSWSPDGSKLVFMSQSVDPCCSAWQIWAVNREGKGASNLINDESVNDLFPSWSPDGTQIVFSRSNGLGFDLYAMPASASLPPAALAPSGAPGGATRLTTHSNVSDPDWAAIRTRRRPRRRAACSSRWMRAGAGWAAS
jgi:dipeptidyl aminopeptidase/acylaminoacyl peptidase